MHGNLLGHITVLAFVVEQIVTHSLNRASSFICVLSTNPLSVITENDSSIQTGITDQLDLNQYNRTNTNKKLFECETCGKGFTQRCHLNEHNRIHTGERPFKCHSDYRIHTGKKLFECDLCGKRFNQKVLRKDIKIYSDKYKHETVQARGVQ
ncbi:hypothetical protein DINM_001464 [Dirofilaria immitis]|nr:hypothetical protein [Dirofilaria immitis]